MSGVTPPLPLYTFVACTGTTLRILFTYILNIWQAVVVMEVSEVCTKSHQTDACGTECSFQVGLSSAELAASLTVPQNRFLCSTAGSPTVTMTTYTNIGQYFRSFTLFVAIIYNLNIV